MGEVTAKRLKFSDLKFLEDNPRTITADDLQRLAGRIKDDPTFFDNRPCLVNFTGGKYLCYAGFQRSHAAAKILKWKDVPCMVENDVPSEVMRKRAILDNTHDGKWDADVLSSWEFEVEELREMGVPEWVFGGDGEEEDGVPNNALNSEAKEDDFEPPEIETVKTDIVPGDLFEIGRHRLLCGDSASADDVRKLMGNDFINMIFIDPPYAVNYGRDQAELQKKSGRKFSTTRANSQIQGDNLTTQQCADEIWKPAFKNLYDFAQDDCSFYMTMCQGGDQMMMMMMMMSQKWQIKHELIWVKNAPVFSMGRLDYDYKHEPILFGWKKKHKFYAKGEFQNSVWEIPKSHKSDLHPTMKPVALVANAMLNSSREEQVVADFFLGSGTTMVAAHQLNRRCYGMEIDCKYVEVIVRRMMKLDPTLEIKRNGHPYQK